MRMRTSASEGEVHHGAELFLWCSGTRRGGLVLGMAPSTLASSTLNFSFSRSPQSCVAIRAMQSEMKRRWKDT